MMKLFLRSVILAAVVVFTAVAGQAADISPNPDAIGAAPLPADPASVVVWGRTLVQFRVPLEYSTPEHRARAAAERIRGALPQIDPERIHVVPVQLRKAEGVQVLAGPVFLLSLMQGDLDGESGQTLDEASQAAVEQFRSLARDYARQHSVPAMVRAGVQALIATALFVAFWAACVAFRGRTLAALEAGRAGQRAALVMFGYDWRPVLVGVMRTATRLLMLTLVLAGAYGWLTYVLGRFPYTQRWADELGHYLYAAVASLAAGALQEIPNLIALLVIYLVTRGLIRILNGWFLSVENRRFANPWLDPEAARATRRLTDIGVWVVALVVAFPYLPGSHSEAFKGVSVFIGLMLSLGGAGFVSQIIGGMAAVYSRAVRSGDYIIVGEVQGVVQEIGLLTTKVATRTREEVTVPNALLVNTPIRNFSRAQQRATALSTAITIGYDTPWRQVQALLVQAAAQTEGVLAEPAPYVLQTALDDFYVRYELTVCTPIAAQRNAVLARLHAAIQDQFNQHGVQIMSPHFRSQPAVPVVVPPAQWFAKPAAEEPRTPEN